MKVEMQFLPYFFLLRQKSKINDFSNEEYVGSKIFPALDLLSVPIAASGFAYFLWQLTTVISLTTGKQSQKQGTNQKTP